MTVRLAVSESKRPPPALSEKEAACEGIVAVVILFTAPAPPVAMATGHSGPATSLCMAVPDGEVARGN